MSLESELRARSGSVCELGGSEESLRVFDVPPDSGQHILMCLTCFDQ